MTRYEELQDLAYREGLTVKEKPLQGNDGRIKYKRIAIREELDTTEKSCVLAEELGHYYTSAGDILDQQNVSNRKQERRARMWAYDHQIGLEKIVDCYKAGCRNRYEAAKHLGVTEEFLDDCMMAYRDKYGVCKRTGSYIVMFEPRFGVVKMF